jgi:hypothetical protein
MYEIKINYIIQLKINKILNGGIKKKITRKINKNPIKKKKIKKKKQSKKKGLSKLQQPTCFAL